MENKDYNINIFRPKTKHAKINSRIIFISIIIWAVAVFGFQIALKVLEKPVPEKGYITFNKVWTKAQSGKIISVKERKDLSKVYLTLLGKYVGLRNNVVLKKAFTATVMPITKKGNVQRALGLSNDSLLAKVIPYALVSNKKVRLTRSEKQQLPKIMKKYLIHNRSVLTDTKFLGFPFHYFYTAVFLLILFVCICWTYCFIIQKVNADLGINED